MNQTELKQFFERLAKAEQAAAEQIEQAQAAAEQSLNVRRQQLSHEHQQQLDILRRRFDLEQQALMEEMEAFRRQREEQVALEIDQLQQHHLAQQQALVNWLLARVKQP